MASQLVVELYNQAPEYTFTERTPELSIQNRLDRGTLILTHGRAQPLVVIKRTGEKAFARPFDGHAPVTRANGKGETDHLAQGVIELDTQRSRTSRRTKPGTVALTTRSTG